MSDDESAAIQVFDVQWFMHTIQSVCDHLSWTVVFNVRVRNGLLVTIDTLNGGPYTFRITAGKHGWFAHIDRVRKDAHADAVDGDETVLVLFSMIMRDEVRHSIAGGIHHVTS